MTVKYYIYKSKCFNNVPDMFGLLNDMKNLYITSKIISIKMEDIIGLKQIGIHGRSLKIAKK